MTRTLALVLGVAVLAGAAAGCGGNGGGDDAAEPAAWATGFCRALTGFTTAIAESGKGLEGEGLPSGEQVVGAVRSAAEAAGTFSHDLRELGPPDVSSGDEIIATLTDAASSAEATFRDIEAEVGGEITSAADVAVRAGKIAAAAQKALTGIRDATNRLQELDVDGQLAAALSAAAECKNVGG